MALPQPSLTAIHTFRCLDAGHLIREHRNIRGPLATRQSTWCAAHDCPAVGFQDREPAARGADEAPISS